MTRKKGQDITHLLNFQFRKDNEYVRENELVTRCGGFAELYVNEEKKATTDEYTSGSVCVFPGENWTGILPDVSGQRFGQWLGQFSCSNHPKIPELFG